jgi:hypothetical protein
MIPAPVHGPSALPSETQLRVLEIQGDVYRNLLWVLEPLIDGDWMSASERARELRDALATTTGGSTNDLDPQPGAP